MSSGQPVLAPAFVSPRAADRDGVEWYRMGCSVRWLGKEEHVVWQA